MHACSVDKLERNRGGVDGASGRCDKSVCSRVEAWGEEPDTRECHRMVGASGEGSAHDRHKKLASAGKDGNVGHRELAGDREGAHAGCSSSATRRLGHS